MRSDMLHDLTIPERPASQIQLLVEPPHHLQIFGHVNGPTQIRVVVDVRDRADQEQLRMLLQHA